MMTQQPRRVLLVEDSIDDAHAVRRAVGGREDVFLEHVRSIRAAEAAMAAGHFDSMILDYRLPDGSGVKFCADVRSRGFVGPVLVVSSVHSDWMVRQAREAGANAVAVKDDYFEARVNEILAAQAG